MLYLFIGIALLLIGLSLYYFKRKASRLPEEVTLLIIGPPSCGKTAIIYFLYRFASNYLTTKRDTVHNEPSNVQPSTNSQLVKEIDLATFVNQIIAETLTTSNFVGTPSDSITYINHNIGRLSLKIYNISGELFSDIGKNEKIIREFANHLEMEKVKSTFCLLADEASNTNASKYNITWQGVDALFSANGLIKSQHIFSNIKNNINVLRVVTKFDNIHPAQKPTNKSGKKKVDFAIISKAILDLNHHGTIDSMHHHHISYPVPEPSQFNGTNKKFWEQFICTGLYDKTTFSNDIYELDEESQKDVLKSVYRGSGLNRLEMYGIGEIFTFILKGLKAFRGNEYVKPPNDGRTPEEILSNEDYKKILNYK